MRTARLSQCYAKALLKTSSLDGREDAVRADLAYLESLTEESGEFMIFLSPYFITTADRSDVLKILFKDRVNSLTMEFLLLLEHKRELRLLHSIFVYFRQFYLRRKGITQVRIRTAFDLDETQEAAFTRQCTARFGDQSVLSFAQDPALLGGFAMATDTMMYDYSLLGRLDRLRRRMGEA